jgi:alpha-beta hydrolase superfamily lysophospholipase
MVASLPWRRLAATVALSVAACLAVASAARADSPPPPYAVWGNPLGGHLGKAPVGVVLVLPGSGWTAVTPPEVHATQGLALPYQNNGFETATVAYRAGAQGLADVDSFYNEAKARYPGLPICAAGGSSGGHLALMLAVLHPNISCVISLAGPTDLPELTAAAHRMAVDAFGSGLWSNSPLRFASWIHAPTMLVYAANDPLVPPAQGTEFEQARPATTLTVLPSGSAHFVHSDVNRAALQRASAAEIQFAVDATR